MDGARLSVGSAGMTALTNPTQVVLALVCILLLGAIGYEMAAPLPQPELPAAATTLRPIATAPLPVFHPPPSESFDEINARPVFDRARAPVVADTSTTIGSFSGSSTSPPAISLVGIIIDGPRRLAMIRSPSAPVAATVSVGDSVEGWKVTEIDSDRLVLRSGSGNAEIKLNQAHITNSGAATGTAPALGSGPGANPPAPMPETGPVASPPPDRSPH